MLSEDAPSYREGENRTKKRRITRPVDYQPASLLPKTPWRSRPRSAVHQGPSPEPAIASRFAVHQGPSPEGRVMICGALGAIVGTRQTASPISIHEGPIIEKKGLRGWSSRCSHLSALWFRCPGVPREAMKFSSSLVRMRDRARVVLPCVRDGGRAMRLISSHLGTRSRSGGKAEILKGPRERKQVRRLTGG